MANKIVDAIGTVLLAAGLFIALSSHAVHEKIGLPEASHWSHIILGLMLTIIGLGMLIHNNNALKIWNKSLTRR